MFFSSACRLLAVCRPSPCQLATSRWLCSCHHDEQHSSIQMFNKLRRARKVSMGAVVQCYRENPTLFTPAHHVFALMMIDIEASVASYDARSFAAAAERIRRVPEVIELVELSAQGVTELDAHLVRNLLFFLSQYSMFGQLHTVLSTHTRVLDKLDTDELLLVGDDIAADETNEMETWPSVIVLSSYVLQRLSSKAEKDIVDHLCKLLLIVSRHRLAATWPEFPEALALVRKHAGEFSAEKCSGIARAACNLSGEQATKLLSALSEVVVSTVADANARLLAYTMLAYGLYAPAGLGMEFWNWLLGRAEAVFANFSPGNLVMVCRAVSAAPAIDRLDKARFLLHVAEESLNIIGKFEPNHLCSLLSVYSSAKFIHKKLFSEISGATLCLLPLCKPAILADIIHHLVRLKHQDSLLLTEAAGKLAQGVKDLSAEQLPRVAFAFAAASHKDESLLSALAAEVQLRWKSIPMEEFKEVCRCLESLGYVSKQFEDHKFFRFADTEKPLSKAVFQEIRAGWKNKKRIGMQRKAFAARRKKGRPSGREVKALEKNRKTEEVKSVLKQTNSTSSERRPALGKKGQGRMKKPDRPSKNSNKTTQTMKGKK